MILHLLAQYLGLFWGSYLQIGKSLSQVPYVVWNKYWGK